MAISDSTTPDRSPDDDTTPGPVGEPDPPPLPPFALVILGALIIFVGWSMTGAADPDLEPWGVFLAVVGLCIGVVGLVALGTQAGIRRYEWLVREAARVEARRSTDQEG